MHSRSVPARSGRENCGPLRDSGAQVRFLQRLLMLLIVLLLVSFLSFLLANLLPGNLAIDILGPAATKAGIAELDRQLHLSQPLLVRYFDWLGNALRGNLGESYHTGQPVSQALAQRLPVTAELLVLSQVIALAVAVPLGILSALRPGGKLDKAAGAGSFGLLAFPPYVLAVLLVLAFAVRFRVFPATGYVPLTQDPLGKHQGFAAARDHAGARLDRHLHTGAARRDDQHAAGELRHHGPEQGPAHPADPATARAPPL